MTNRNTWTMGFVAAVAALVINAPANGQSILEGQTAFDNLDATRGRAPGNMACAPGSLVRKPLQMQPACPSRLPRLPVRRRPTRSSWLMRSRLSLTSSSKRFYSSETVCWLVPAWRRCYRPNSSSLRLILAAVARIQPVPIQMTQNRPIAMAEESPVDGKPQSVGQQSLELTVLSDSREGLHRATV